MADTKKVALVFGGSRGIGAAIVERLARDGYATAFTYVSSEVKAHELAKRTGAAPLRADSSDASQITAAVATTVKRLGKLDVVVVNAGLLNLGTIDTVAVETLDTMLSVNVRGVYLAVQAAALQMNDGGRVITIGSNTASHTGMAGASVYQMTKAAVAAMVKGVALDLAPRGITVNNVQPGPTDTDMNTTSLDLLKSRSPLKRVADPAEIAGLVSYVARDEASYMTGASLTIDGGWTL